jgi:hypothetical protein
MWQAQKRRRVKEACEERTLTEGGTLASGNSSGKTSAALKKGHKLNKMPQSIIGGIFLFFGTNSLAGKR